MASLGIWLGSTPAQRSPFGVIGSRRHRHEPYIFSSTDIDALLRGAQGLRTRFACATHHSMIGLLAATGMRVGEVIRLDRTDLCPTDGRLLIRESKFGKSRIVPLHPLGARSAAALRQAARRHPPSVDDGELLRLHPRQQDGLSHRSSGIPKPLRRAGIGADAPSRPGFTTCDIPSPSAP